MIRRTSGLFRTYSVPPSVDFYGTNFLDAVYSNPAPVRKYAQHTGGTTLLDRLTPIFPPTVEKCSLLSFSVTAKLNLVISELSQPEDSTYGKFGKIITGLTQIGAPTSGAWQTHDSPWTSKVQSLPNDLTLVSDLWNPASDPLPPQLTSVQLANFPQNLQVGITNTLPNPIPLFRGTEVLIGFWVLPSLLRCAALGDNPVSYLLGWDASYSLVYDDGQE